MSAKTEQRSARGFARVGLAGLARLLSLIWLAPALLFNVDWTGHASWHANFAAVVMILGSALFIEGGLRFRSWVLTPLCVVSALFLVVVNTKQATRTLSFASEAASEAKQAQINAGSHLASQRSQLESRRQAQVQLVGETAVGTLEAELVQLKASEARRWNQTKGCDPSKITSSAEFCAQVAGLTGKIEAAKKRDQIDAEMRSLPTAPVELGIAIITPAVADPYVANVKTMANELGFQPSDRIIRAEEALSRALAFELLAALGPTCWLAFVTVVSGAASAGSSRAKPVAPKKERTEEPEAKDGEPKATADDIERFIADELEAAPLPAAMRSGDMRKLAHTWFASRGLPKPVEQELWAKVRQHFKHDPNNGRPRYLGVKPRAKVAVGPQLVVNNS